MYAMIGLIIIKLYNNYTSWPLDDHSLTNGQFVHAKVWNMSTGNKVLQNEEDYPQYPTA